MSSFSVVCCVYCYMGSEDKFAKQATGVTVIVPYKIRREKEKGHWTDKKIKLIPGYAFVYADSLQEIIDLQKTHRIKILSYSNKSYALQGSDLELAKWVWNNNGVIGVSTAIHENDKVKITEGPLKETNGLIVKLDKRHRLAKVQLSVGIHVWLSFDWLDDENK